MHYQVTPEQRPQIFVPLQKKTTRKETASSVCVSQPASPAGSGETIPEAESTCGIRLAKWAWHGLRPDTENSRKDRQSGRVEGIGACEAGRLVTEAGRGVHEKRRQAHIARTDIPARAGGRKRGTSENRSQAGTAVQGRRDEDHDKGQLQRVLLARENHGSFEGNLRLFLRPLLFVEERCHQRTSENS